jgi:hypothetical protein
MIEGSGCGSGSIPLSNGSSGRPKNMWIRWILTGFRSGSATLIITFSSLVKPAANYLKFAVKTGLVSATIILYTSMTRV